MLNVLHTICFLISFRSEVKFKSSFPRFLAEHKKPSASFGEQRSIPTVWSFLRVERTNRYHQSLAASCVGMGRVPPPPPPASLLPMGRNRAIMTPAYQERRRCPDPGLQPILQVMSPCSGCAYQARFGASLQASHRSRRERALRRS